MQSESYLIHKAGRGWYRPGQQGYTINIAEAGHYSLEGAMLHTYPNGPDGPRDGLSFDRAPITPPAADLVERNDGQIQAEMQVIIEKTIRGLHTMRQADRDMLAIHSARRLMAIIERERAAALTIARPAILEEAAKVADEWAKSVMPPEDDTTVGAIGGVISAAVAEQLAAAIRALKGQ
jgi:hypothetical protein